MHFFSNYNYFTKRKLFVDALIRNKFPIQSRLLVLRFITIKWLINSNFRLKSSDLQKISSFFLQIHPKPLNSFPSWINVLTSIRFWFAVCTWRDRISIWTFLVTAIDCCILMYWNWSFRFIQSLPNFVFQLYNKVLNFM